MLKSKIEKEDVLERIANWKSRLETLFSDIKSWSANVQDIDIQENRITQAREDLMVKFDVEPEKIPVLALIHEKVRVSFIPIAIWTIGANGRVNISTNRNQYIMVDHGSFEDKTVHWVIVNPMKRDDRVDFDCDALMRLLRDEDIFA
jgi:hypothetical protein